MMLVLLLGFLGCVRGDTPANCTYDDIVGTWNFYESQRDGDSTIDCSGKVSFVEKSLIELLYPNTAKDQFGNIGTWTMVYNQGFEVNVNGRSYFGFSDFTILPDKGGVLSHCDRTKRGQGWSHDVTVRNWACLSARKVSKKGMRVEPKFHVVKQDAGFQADAVYRQEEWEVDLINGRQNKWVATTYPQLQGLRLEEIKRMKGGENSRLYHRPTQQAKLLKQSDNSFIPDSWDWRNVDGVNYIPEVRNQGGCGSCYAFSSMGMLEARLRILTKNAKNYTLSPQDIVSCSVLSQGCSGGFPYLIAGRYAKDYGVVEEECNEYTGEEGQCTTKACTRRYVSDYSYVGGYFGGCNEEKMKQALVNNGPLAVAFEVYSDFMMYKSGVYHHTKLLNAGDFTPFELTNHAVLLIGYGHDKTLKEDYWIVQNSWGQEWGEDGFFRIRRGVDECAIESIAVEATPIP